MFRGIVLGDFWGIEESVWVDLWAGLLGAIPAAIMSAVVAALVAMWVLDRSNKHQTKLAATQLAEQKNEAFQVRKKAVMADLLGAAAGFNTAADAGADAVEAQRVAFQTHAYRWELEVSDRGHELELLAWANVLWKPAWHLALVKDAPRSTRAAWSRFLGEVIGAVSTLGMVIVPASDTARREFLEFVKTRRGEFNSRWDEELAFLPRHEDLDSAENPS